MEAETLEWVISEYIVGSYKKYKNLSFYIVHNSGHMVPAD